MRVCRVRNLQKERYEGKKIRRNTQLEGELLKKYCALGTKEEAMMRQAFERFSLTARSYHRILRVARTIADLDGREKISDCARRVFPEPVGPNIKILLFCSSTSVFPPERTLL